MRASARTFAAFTSDDDDVDDEKRSNTGDDERRYEVRDLLS